MTSIDSGLPNTPSRRTYSCVRCYDRKVKCDRQQPACSNCLKQKLPCVFRPQPTTSRKRPKLDHDNGRSIHCNSRLEADEATNPKTIVQSLPSDSIQCKEISGHKQPPTPVSIISENQSSISKPQLVQVQDRSKFVDNSLWTSVVEEVQDPEEALEEDSSANNDAEEWENDDGFAIGITDATPNNVSHPNGEHIQKLWQIFIENVDPMMKIIHVPSMEKAIQKATSSVDGIPKSFEALLFAIYSSAIMSLKDDECMDKFGESRKTLLVRFSKLTRAALARAKFLSSVNLVVLQALVLHLLSVRDTIEPRSLWTLSGVALRLAESMGLHRDGAALGLPPFETEIRRRVWWHLRLFDFQTAELCGLPKFRSNDLASSTCKRPTNVNDDQLYPGMPSPPVELTRCTDMIFVTSRLEFFAFAMEKNAKFKAQVKDQDDHTSHESRLGTLARDSFIEEAEELMESRFLRYCDPSVPLELMTMHCTRSLLNIARFIAHHPRFWTHREYTAESERQYVWDGSIKLLAQKDIMQSTPQLQRFAWNIPYQWHALIHVLTTLRATPLVSDAAKAWRLIEALYKHNPDMISNTKRAIFIAVGNLCVKAWDAREAALIKGGSASPSAPDFITDLRSQREAAAARRRARAAKIPVTKTVSIVEQSNATKEANESNLHPSSGNHNHESSKILQNAISPPTDIESSQQFNDSNPSWFGEGLEHLLGTSAYDMMNIDADYLLAPDYSENSTPDQPIDWNQWDAWMANMNTIPTSPALGIDKL